MALGKWSERFCYAAIAQGVLVLFFTFLWFIYGSLFLVPAPALVIAGGSAGTWLLVGYTFYAIMVLYLAVASFSYHLLEQTRGGRGKVFNLLSAAHLILTNIGVFGAVVLLMVAGYTGGGALIPTSQGGGGLTALQVHEQILGVYPPYVAAFVGVAILGVLCGGIAYCIALRKK